MNVIWRVSKYLFRYPGLFFGTLALAIAMTGLQIWIPNQIQSILEGVQDSAAISKLWMGIGTIALLYFGSEMANGLRVILNNTLEQKVLMDMRGEIHAKLLQLPVSFYDQRKSGEISSRVIEDVNNVERALLDGTEIGTRALVMLIGVTIVLFSKNAFLAWFVFLPVPILLVLGYFYAKHGRKYWKKVRVASGDLNSLLVEDIQGNRLIQTFGLQKRESARFYQRADTLRNRMLAAMYRWAVYNPGTNFLTNLGTVSVIGVGGYLILNDASDFGFPAMVAFLMLANMIYMPIGQLHQLNHLIVAGKASGERVFEVLDAKIDVEDPAHPKAFPEGLLEFDFRNVTFQYPERPPVLQDFNLTLAPGKVTALVGHTGAGKSTIANLAMRSYDTTKGVVTINGADIREFSLHDLHQQIGHVAQDPFLFEGTVRENLLLAKEDATADEIERALRGSSAWDFVQKMPDGVDTNIGEKGIRLSQGEKQRLTIARVLLKNPPMVILDEATASVDTITERQIQHALENLMSERTVLVIAHRLSTIRKADQIVVLENGGILEQGTHDELLLNNGRYANLWLHQVDVIQEYEDEEFTREKVADR
ncbi:ABC transporter ATP-binding protein [Cerasicoccus arenae]|uniref:ABC transporter permease/ATP-binding protein n=1 Tax=Cerasicoccus arenae TaxID=424488 RepID=A0A8J3DBS4_9BACT|nr:ABC transporter ATP-binding protein [Cerasicoccus arenae]MBK1857242.1 ABC transporter ATP-binding protein [Cerasicoccus arenae]GHC00225.1 ABC transporter permease/ATP-binding protein [Cerasicoccus arenae]